MSDRAAVLFANQAFYAAFSARDMPAMDEVWSKHHQVSCIHPGWPAVRGREDVMGSWRGILRSPGSPTVKALAAEADITGDVAIVTCVEQLDGRNYLAATNLFVRSGPRWKMIHHQAGPANVDPRRLPEGTDDPPPSAMN